jgi:hypothetical protein
MERRCSRWSGLLAFGLTLGAGGLRADEPHLLSPLPVQHDGRVMPLDTLARDAVWRISGARRLRGEHPMATVARWMQEPNAAAREANVLLGSSEIAGLLGTTESRASLAELIQSHAFAAVLARVDAARQRKETRQGLLAAAEAVQERMWLLRALLEGRLVRPLPSADPRAPWVAPEVRLAAVALGPRLTGWPAPEAIEREIVYNELQPERLAWVALLAALAISLAGWDGRRRLFDWLSLGALSLGAAAAAGAVAARWAIAGRPPASTTFDVLLWAAGAVALAALLARATRQGRLLAVGANGVAALALLLADALPLDAFIRLGG